MGLLQVQGQKTEVLEMDEVFEGEVVVEVGDFAETCELEGEGGDVLVF